MRRNIVLVLAMFIIVVAQAQSFDEILYAIAQNNQQLKAQTKINESIVQTVKSENVLDAPEVGFEHNWSNHGLGTKWGLSLSQNFDWPGVYGKRGKAVAATISAMDYLNRCNYIDKLLEIKLAMIDVVNINERMNIYRLVRDNMQQLADKYQKAYANGEVSILDLNKIKIQCVAIERQLSQLKIQQSVLRSSLETLNGGGDCSCYISQLNDYPQDELHSEDDYVAVINEHDPEISYNQLLVKSEKYNADAAKMSRFPGFSVGYKYTNELGDVFNGFTVGLSLPFFSQNNKIKATRAIQEAEEYKLQQIKVQKLATLYAQRQQALTLHKEIEQYSFVFVDSDNMQLLQKALDGGQISLIDYLQEVNFFLSAQQDYLDVIYQYHLTVATLNRYWLIK